VIAGVLLGQQVGIETPDGSKGDHVGSILGGSKN
jgi:hypothetical protein